MTFVGVNRQGMFIRFTANQSVPFQASKVQCFGTKVPFTQQVRDERSSSGLSQDKVAILQQFESQGPVTEQQVYTPRYPLQDNFSPHFTNPDVADRAQNEAFFNKIEEGLKIKLSGDIHRCGHRGSRPRAQNFPV
jgi:hypothetical protein